MTLLSSLNPPLFSLVNTFNGGLCQVSDPVGEQQPALHPSGSCAGRPAAAATQQRPAYNSGQGGARHTRFPSRLLSQIVCEIQKVYFAQFS